MSVYKNSDTINTRIKPEHIYGAATLLSNRKMGMEQIQKTERRSLEKY